MEESVAREKINSIIRRDCEIEHILKRLEETFQMIAFGGVVRDVLFDCEEKIRDIDMVLCPPKNMSDKEQEWLVKKILQTEMERNVSINQFGGYKIKMERKKMDVWLLKDTWAFRKNLLETDPDNLLKSVYLNIDAYALNCSVGNFIADCHQRKYKEIDIVLEQSDCEELNLVRAVVFSRKYSMNLSDRIQVKLFNMLQQWRAIEKKMFQIEMKHYGTVVVTKEDIEDVIKGV